MGVYYLAHSRTKGSVNGVRLYQYEDGRWTPEGLERRRADYRAARKAPHGFARVIGTAAAAAGATAGSVAAYNAYKQNPKGAGAGSSLQIANNKAGDIITNASKINEGLASSKKPYDPYLNDLSTKDLKAIVERLELEERYKKNVDIYAKKGQERLETFLKVGGGAVALAGSVAGLIAAIAAIKNAKS